MGTASEIWVLQGARAGDNAQARALAEQLDASFVLKPLMFNAWHHLPNVLAGASVRAVREGGDALVPPWPKLVIATGKRAAPVALWIKRQSGGATKLVHLGRPRADLRNFDLVITTPQYGLPDDANVVTMALPFAPRQKAGDIEKWRAAWNDLPRPLTAVLVGAGKYPIAFGAHEAKKLAERIDRLDGSALLIASPRTDESVLAAAMEVKVPHLAYPWGAANPLAAALALADRFIVTSDSVSMQADVAQVGKPLEVFALPVSPFRLRWSGRAGLGAALARRGVLQPPRDVAGLANTSRAFATQDEVIRRVKALLASA